ncbi:spore coat protein CotJB [Clostridium intestinale]|uniref:spore coat protein CotJB n=1 Tax=Clostridium intestinale TaxID=36845 RepID=UPI002DD66178|nr:spore coat protein CotJB [Clostridium intestinale]WRY53905.1 spore coat protein CotJB [Clostridium intestinale]
MDKKDLLKKIQEVGFSLVDVNLYLDNYEDNKDALEYFNCLSKELMDLRKEYEKKYGPLTNYGLQTAKDWDQWVSGPWPWERKFND